MPNVISVFLGATPAWRSLGPPIPLLTRQRERRQPVEGVSDEIAIELKDGRDGKSYLRQKGTRSTRGLRHVESDTPDFSPLKGFLLRVVRELDSPQNAGNVLSGR